MGRERRENGRFSFRSEIQVEMDRQPPFKTWAVNLSMGGVCFVSPRRLQPPDIVKVRFLVEGESSLVLNAAVRHATQVTTEVDGQQTGAQIVVGVEFDRLLPAEEIWLEHALQTLAEEEV
jgi:hypothetical protein